jgi:hypothetical protein
MSADVRVSVALRTLSSYESEGTTPTYARRFTRSGSNRRELGVVPADA